MLHSLWSDVKVSLKEYLILYDMCVLCVDNFLVEEIFTDQIFKWQCFTCVDILVVRLFLYLLIMVGGIPAGLLFLFVTII